MPACAALKLLVPEILLIVAASVAMLGEAFTGKGGKGWLRFALVSVVAAGVAAICTSCGVISCSLDGKACETTSQVVFGMLAVDPSAIFFKLVILAAVVMVIWLCFGYAEFDGLPMGTFSGMLLLGTVGMLLLVAATDFLIAVIALELLSITSFIMTGYIFNRASSGEAALKFFLVGTFSAALLLFGISYYYGYFGTTSILAFTQFASRPDLILALLVVFIVAGLGFKLSMAPFHMWAPDAYEGAPTPVTAFLSVAPKAAAIAFILRAFGNHEAMGVTPLLAGLAAITMTVGNLGALQQTNVKRLIAYSSIAQVGYILVAIVAGGAAGTTAVLVYTFFYVFMNMGLFAALAIVSGRGGNEDIPVFAGLSKRSMGLSLALVVFMLSLTGLPPLSGFFGKFSVFAAVIAKPELTWLGVVAVLNSVISLFYYFRIINQAFFRDGDDAAAPLGFTAPLVSCLVVTLVVTMLGGILPHPLLGLVKCVVGS